MGHSPQQQVTPAAKRPLVIAAVGAWSMVVTVVAVFAFFHPETHSVFPVYVEAAHRWWARSSLYAPSTTDEYLYSPFFAVAISPLAYLSLRWGTVLWKLISAGFFSWALWVWTNQASPDPLTSDEKSLIFLITLGAGLQSISQGNPNLITFGAVLLGMAALARKDTSGAGLWIGSATVVKAFPLILAALLAATFGLGLLGPFAAAIAAGLALPIAMAPRFGIVQTRSWFRTLVAKGDQRELRHISVDQLFRIMKHPLPTIWANLLAAACGLAVLFLCLSYARRVARRDALSFTLAAFCAWLVLFLPSMEPATVVILAPPIALAVLQMRRKRSGGWLVLLWLAWWLCGPGLTDIAGGRARAFTEAHGASAIGGLLFAVYLIAVWRKPPGWTPIRAASDP